MTALKSARTLAASLGVLAFGALAATPAMAFDNLEWNWKKDVRENVNIDVKINVNVNPTGLVEVEKLQIFLGDVTATNYVAHIYNEPFYPETGHYGTDYYVPEQGREIQTSFCYSGCGGGYRDGWDKVPVKPLNAVYELPILLASATAVGNNQSITSDVPVFLHDGQFVADVKDYRYGGGYDLASLAGAMPDSSSYGGHCYYNCNNQPQGNLFHDYAALFLLGAGFGILKEADISAKSTVYDVKNVSVDNSATAVANNISVSLLSDNPANHVLIADITQFAFADVKAETRTTNVTATGYDHMRQLTTATLSPTDSDPTRIVNVPTPWVSSTATAVGNNVSINVGPVLAE